MGADVNNRKRLFLIDGYAMVYRAHFAMFRNPLITSDGRHTSALFGFINSMFKLYRDENPDYLAIVFDSKEKTFRHEMYPEYKATREKMPDELRAQLPDLWRLVDAMNIPRFEMAGYEADDIIGAIAIQAEESGMETYIVSGDKDFMQLVNDNIFVYTPGRQNAQVVIYNRDKVKEKWAVSPEQFVDLLGLMGDKSDNVPGVTGVGEVTAKKLLKEYGSLDNILAHAGEVKNKRAREGLLNEREMAKLSKELVTIKTDLPLDVTIDELKMKSFNFSEMSEIFRELEFFSLQSQLQAFQTDVEPEITKPTVEKEYHCIDSPSELKNLVKSLQEADLFSVDIESTSTDPMTAKIVGFSFSIEPHKGWYIPIQFPEKKTELFSATAKDIETVLQSLKQVLENPHIRKCGQNIKYDAIILKNYGIDIQGIVFDTMIAAHLLKPDVRSYKLDYLSLEHLQYKMQPITDLIGKGKNQISMADVSLEKVTFYAVEDADVTLQLAPILKKELESNHLLDFLKQVEIPLIPVLVQMEKNGVYVDKYMMGSLSTWMESKLRISTGEIHELAGTNFNINSPKQLAVILFDMLSLPKIRKRSTDVNVLEFLKHQHPLPEKVLKYRKFHKLKSTYVDAIPKLIHPETGRIHSSFNQTVAATGRLSSSNPNFQNIPIRKEEGREIRKAFRPQKAGWVIFSADYSQIELRIMAHLSGDDTLKQAFLAGEDIHSHTASLIYGVPRESVLPEMRRTAKLVNFGVMYGAGPFRISQELGIPINEAKQIIKAYFERYSGINNFINNTLEQARNNKYVSTMLGRRRYCYDIDNANQRVRTAVERAAINMPIQGTAAEMIKLAMITIHKTLNEENFKTKMILQIHDELLFEVPEDELDEVQEMVVETMEKALPLDIPIIVDSGVGDSWFEAH